MTFYSVPNNIMPFCYMPNKHYGFWQDPPPIPCSRMKHEEGTNMYYEVKWVMMTCNISFRFGWYIPEAFAAKSPPIKDHWRAFTNSKVTALFSPTSVDEEFILSQMKRSDGRWGYFNFHFYLVVESGILMHSEEYFGYFHIFWMVWK